jgi:hypothetical protein
MHRLATISIAIFALLTAASAQQPKTDTDFRRTDPVLLSTTGRPQLVEFFHPT